MSRWAAGWRPALRIAARDARRHRARSALVLLMIALPVTAVAAADVVMATSDVSGTESLGRRLGSADALVTVEDGVSRVQQGFDPDVASGSEGGGGSRPSLEQVRRALGRDIAAAVPWRSGHVRVLTDGGVAETDTSVLDLTAPVTEGLFRLARGRPPRARDEVVINTALADRGFGLGDTLGVEDGGDYTVVGIGESTALRGSPFLVGTAPALADPSRTRLSWLVKAGPVSWDDVRRLNAVGASVLSRAVLLDPPPDSELPAEVRQWTSSPVSSSTVAVVSLVVVMALLELVLLAGPAFAVGARRQARTLALLGAAGGTPRQTRRVVLASAVVLGTAGAGLGVGASLVVARAALPLLQRLSGSWFGPFEVRPLHLAAVAALGLLSALLAAVVPAWLASRADVVAVLGGRRGDRRPSTRSPLLGLALVATGVAGAVHGARSQTDGEVVIAASAVLSVLGMVLLVSVVVAGLAAVSRRLPLALRYAVRDAARHRTRTVPAVAAAAATVAGVVALGIGNASDAAQNRAMYSPLLPPGLGAVSGPPPAGGWQRVEAAVAAEVPGARLRRIRGLGAPRSDRFEDVSVRVPRVGEPLENWGLSGGSTVLVHDDAAGAADDLDILQPWLSAEQDARLRRALGDGRAVVFASRPAFGDRARVVRRVYGADGDQLGRATRVEVPATVVRVLGASAPAQAVLPASLAARHGIPVSTTGVLVDPPGREPLGNDRAQAVDDRVAALGPDLSFYVERGFQAQDETVLVQVVLGVLAAVLTVGGTLTATFLALADARPDLATLAAVGAAPRTRRAVAAAYALLVGGVGAVLGVLVGLVPGIAVTYPLTSDSWATVDARGRALADHYLEVPWLLVGVVVVALPLLTAAVVGASARSRLPLAARIE